VLVVSHKRAALEVVSNRLKQKGMSDFFALVHDVKFDQRSLYTNIDSQVQRLEEYEAANNGLDKIYLEREYANSVRLLTQLNKHSEEFRKALFDTKACGYSAHELYLRADAASGTIDLSDVYTQYPAKELEDLIYKVSTYAVYSAITPAHPDLWKHRIEMPDLNRQKLSQWISQAEAYKASVDELTKMVRLYDAGLSIALVEELQQSVPVLTALHTSITKHSVDEVWNAIPDKQQLSILTKELEKVHLLQETYDTIYKAYSFEALYLIRGILKTAEAKVGNPFSWLIWKLFSAEYATLKDFAAVLYIPLTKSSIPILKQQAETIISAEKSLELIARNSSLDILLQEGKALKDIHVQVAFFHTSLSALKAEHAALTQYLSAHPANKLNAFLSGFLNALQVYKEMLPKTLVYFSAEQHAITIQDTQTITKWMAFVDQHLDDLYHLDQLLATLSAADRLCIQRLEQSVHKNIPQSWSTIVQQSVLKLWIYHLELMYPVLRSMNTLSWKQYAQDWEIHSGKRKELSLEMILGKLREQTYRELVFNRLQNRITYRDLQHQVTKKRLIWPVRKLIQHHAEELFSLLPCWMMSPEQVSCVFPMEQLFDLVIIDEASQCYTEHSLPAISRAKQIVIAGDSQQLSPSDLYRVRWEDEDEQEADIEIDSLLDLGSRYLAGVMLKGHYRSRYPELISFSNNQFYKNQLNYIPNQQDILSSVKPIVYRKVSGVWANHQNDAEAEEVVRITLEKIQAGIHSIGIVCFNFLQAQGIQDLLEAEAINKRIVLPPELFIKNIENVQGDERDLIIFSVGYAPDKNGRFAMQFGSLNMQGGEKRMNVAITRAREQIIIVSSIMPQELRTDHVKHAGPRILKEYPQYAWDCQEYDRSDFFTRNAQPVLKGSTAEKIIEMCTDHSDVQAGITYPFVSLTIAQSGSDHAVLADTDDAAYKLTEYAKYWHFNKPLLLAQKGWNYKQIFSRMCYSQTEEELIQTIIQ
ncbi:MAG: DNA helicase I, partial [Cytophagales bacterium]|nr:DNA helicase I [Cytophaga sp.]